MMNSKSACKLFLLLAWTVVIFVIVKSCLSLTLRYQWGEAQVSSRIVADIASILVVAGLVLPVIAAKKRWADRDVLPIIAELKKYLLTAHLLLIVVIAVVAEEIIRAGSVDVQVAVLLAFIFCSHAIFWLTVKED
jgi:hypothetical protein